MIYKFQKYQCCNKRPGLSDVIGITRCIRLSGSFLIRDNRKFAKRTFYRLHFIK